MENLLLAITLIAVVFSLAFIIILNILFLSYTFYFEIIRKNSPFVPTHSKKHKKQFELLFDFLESLNLKDKKFVDLGSGNGEVVIKFAQNNYQSYGIEVNPFLVFWSRWRARKLKNAFFVKNDIFKINLSDFGIIYVYQLNSVNRKLLPKFENELRSDSFIICHKFALPESGKICLINTIGVKDFLIYKKQ